MQGPPGTTRIRPHPDMRHRPRAPVAPGAWPRTTRGTRDAAGTQVSARYARDPVPAAPAASTGRGPGRCRLSRRGVFATARSCDSPADGLGRGAKHRRNPQSAVAFQPFTRLVVDGSAGHVGSAQKGSARGSFSPRRVQRCFSRPASEHALYRFRRPGRWRLKPPTRAPPHPQTRPVSHRTGPRRTPPDHPQGHPAQRRGQVAANEHIIGTLSRGGGRGYVPNADFGPRPEPWQPRAHAVTGEFPWAASMQTITA